MSMSRAIVKRGHGSIRRSRSGHRRRTRNPGGEPSWGWLFSGIGLGAVSSFAYDTLGPAKASQPPPAVIASDSLAGAGVGMLLAGIVGGIWTKSPSTAAVGVIGGIAAFTVGTVLVVNKIVGGA